jgi:(heptosyl)LPS beta-1,4-glucosyltransferase
MGLFESAMARERPWAGRDMDSHTVAAVLIVKNEAAHLEACLASVQGWVDEIVVLDSGSSDGTVDIATACGARVYQHLEWVGFGKQRQKAQEYVTAEWCLWLDADERITPELRDEIRRVIRSDAGRAVYAFPRLNWFFGRFIRHGGWYPRPVIRLYLTMLARYDDAEVHEEVRVDPGVDVRVLHGDLLHYPYSDLRHYINKSSMYANMWAMERWKRGERSSLFSACMHSVGKFFRMYVLKRGFLDGGSGFLLSVLSSYYVFLKYAELWVLHQGARAASDDA